MKNKFLTITSLITFSNLLFANPAIGLWKLKNSVAIEGGMKWITYKIKKNSLTQIAKCEYSDGTKLRADAEGDGKLEAELIKVWTPGLGIDDNGVHTCRANVASGEYRLEISGNNLTLRFGSGSVVLERASDQQDSAAPPCPIEPGDYAFEGSSFRPVKVRCSSIQENTYIVAEFRSCNFARGYFRHMWQNEWFHVDKATMPNFCQIRLFIDSKTSFRARMEHLPGEPVFRMKKIEK